MTTSKHMDWICCIAVLLALVGVVLFMNGKRLGLQPVAEEAAASSEFTANDRKTDWTPTTRITLEGTGGQVSGNGAYIADGTVHIIYAGSYEITGSLTGSIVVDADGDDKIWILLNGVEVTCSDNAALRVEQAAKVFLTLAEGTENVLSSGAEYSEKALEKGVDGVIYARDDLTINGTGSLRVQAEYKHGIVCNDDLVICGGTVSVEAPQDGIHANDSARFADMKLTISAGDDGVTVSNDDGTGYIYMESGSVTIPQCYEGLEAITITIDGGDLDITPTDDGINANGRNSLLEINGGDISIVNLTGRDADGLDSNGDIFINGGSLFISVSNDGSSCAIDYGSESGGVCEINGGTVIACGSSGMAESMSGTSAQCSVMVNFSPAAAADSTLTLTDENGTALVSRQIPGSFTSAVVSTPDMKQGSTVTLTAGETSETVTLSETATTVGGGFGMMGGHGGFGNRGGWGGNQDGPQQMPENFDPSAMGERPEMPEDFDPSTMGERPEMPEGFDPSTMGERPGMPEDFDPSAMGEMPTPPEGFDENGTPPEGFGGRPGGFRGGRGQMPQDGEFDPSQMPQDGDFDPSQMKGNRGDWSQEAMDGDFDPSQMRGNRGDWSQETMDGDFDPAQMHGNRENPDASAPQTQSEPDNLPLRILLTCASVGILAFGLIFALVKKY